jgi:hypothetical protein
MTTGNCWICGSPAVGTGQCGKFLSEETVGVCLAHIASVRLYKPFVVVVLGDEDYEQAVADLQPEFGG